MSFTSDGVYRDPGPGAPSLETSLAGASADILLAKSADSDADIRLVVAGLPASPPEALAALATDPFVEVRRRVAGNPAAPASVLDRLARDKDVLVRSAVAGNPSAPAYVLRVLSQARRVITRAAVGGNLQTQPEVLAALAADPSVRVRSRVAGNPSTPDEVLAGLAQDPDSVVRQHVGGNPTVRDGHVNITVIPVADESASELPRDARELSALEILELWEEYWGTRNPLSDDSQARFLRSQEVSRVCRYPADDIRRCMATSMRLADVLRCLRATSAPTY